MRTYNHLALSSLLVLLFLIQNELISSYSSSKKVLGDFKTGWRDHWTEEKFTDQPTQYNVVEEGSNRVLKAESNKTASGLWYRLGTAEKFNKISWRWKVKKSLSRKTRERSKF